MRSKGMLALVFGTLATVVACSTERQIESDSEPGAEGADPAQGGREQPSGVVDACSCSVSVNGAQKTIACGAEACVSGQSFTCAEGARISKGGTACADEATPGPSTSREASPPTKPGACPFTWETSTVDFGDVSGPEFCCPRTTWLKGANCTFLPNGSCKAALDCRFTDPKYLNQTFNCVGDVSATGSAFSGPVTCEFKNDRGANCTCGYTASGSAR